MSSYSLGVIVGLAFTFAILLISFFLRKKNHAGDEHYDERQILIRGKGYKISFMTVVVINAFYSLFFYGITKEFVSPQFVVLASAYIGIVVYTLYCIFNDAYLQVGQKAKTWIIVLLIVTISNAYCAIVSLDRGFNDAGFATSFSLNTLFAVSFAVVLAGIAIKYFLDKRGAADEES